MMKTRILAALIALALPGGLFTACPAPTEGADPNAGSPPPGTGRLSYLGHYQSATDLPCDRICLSPDGGNAYVISASFEHLFTFSRDPATGALSILDDWSYNTGSRMKDCVVSPDGRNVYVATQEKMRITWFTRDPATGLLTRELSDSYAHSSLHGLTDLAFSHDGLFLYAVCTFSTAGINPAVWFSRDPATGDLTPAGLYSDLTVVNIALAVTVSPDDRHVYVSSLANAAISCFARDGVSGGLTYRSSYLNPTGDMCSESMFISPDGRFLYAKYATTLTGGIVWFARDAVTGALTREGSFSNPGLSGTSFTPSADWKNLYASGVNSMSDLGAVLRFTRDGGTGELRYESSVTEWDVPDNLLHVPRGLAASPDNRHVYSCWSVPAEDEYGVLWFSRAE